jgi:hypothetical protein
MKSRARTHAKPDARELPVIGRGETYSLESLHKAVEHCGRTAKSALAVV